MSKKVTTILLASLIVALTVTGVYFYRQDSPVYLNEETTKTVVIDENYETYYNVDDTAQGYTETETIAAQATEFVPNDKDIENNTDELVTSDFSIIRVVDHTINEDVQPRVVFGKEFRDCYIKFDNAGNFELYLGVFADGASNTGKYSEHDNIIYVNYDNGKASEYDIIRDDSGNIQYIIVTYGDYDVYFG